MILIKYLTIISTAKMCIIYYAFVRKIQKEKKQLYIKFKTIDANAALVDNAEISHHDTEQNYVYETMTQDQKANMYDFISNFEGAKQKKKLTPKKTKKAKGSTLEMFMGV